MRRIFRWRMTLFVLLAVLVVASARWTDRVNDAQELEREVRLRTGGAGEETLDLARTLIAEGVSEDDAVDVVASMSFVGDGLLEDLGVARLLAVFEQAAPGDARPSSDLLIVAELLEVGRDGLDGFLNLVVQESIYRQVPADVVAAGLYEHGFEYAYGCRVVERASCPVEVAVALTLDRQQADFVKWGRTDCRLRVNVAHPGCLTFADCADEYALVQVTHTAESEAWELARALGHEPGNPGWEEWTSETSEMAESSWEAHETCVIERYGTGEEAYKALVLD